MSLFVGERSKKIGEFVEKIASKKE